MDEADDELEPDDEGCAGSGGRDGGGDLDDGAGWIEIGTEIR